MVRVVKRGGWEDNIERELCKKRYLGRNAKGIFGKQCFVLFY
jgi:hypothetical protein